MSEDLGSLEYHDANETTELSAQVHSKGQRVSKGVTVVHH